MSQPVSMSASRFPSLTLIVCPVWTLNSGIYVECSPQHDLVACLGALGCKYYSSLLDAVSGEGVYQCCIIQTGLACAADGTQLLTSNDDGVVCLRSVASVISVEVIPPL